MYGSEGGGRKRAISRYHLEILQAGLRTSGTSSAPYPTVGTFYDGPSETLFSCQSALPRSIAEEKTNFKAEFVQELSVFGDV